MKNIQYKILQLVLIITISLILCLVLFPTILWAKVIDEQQVSTAVETWVRHVTADARSNAIIERMEPYMVNGETVAYIAHLSGGGFCLCGADDLVLPVYFYCTGGVYDESIPDYNDVLWEIGSRLNYYREGFQSQNQKVLSFQQKFDERAQLWNDLSRGIVPDSPIRNDSRAVPDSMELNMTTIWSQGSPYNDDCPMGDGGRCVVGCVATAATQIMKYWNWPPSGNGSGGFIWDGDDSCDTIPVGGGWLSANWSDSYDWANMPNSCAGGCSPTEEAALAELNREVGVSVEMDYGACESSVPTYYIVDTYIDIFSYDPDARWEWLHPFSEIVLRNEIAWFRPVQIRGMQTDTTGGHSWVIYGYNTQPADWQFLMNIGHGHNWHMWYTLDNCGYDFHQYYVFEIAPESRVRFVGDNDPGDGSPDDPYEDIAEAIALVPTGTTTTLIFYAGSDNTFSTSSLTISKPVILKGKNVTIRRSY